MPDGSGFSLVFSRAFEKVVVHVHGVLDSGSAPALKDRLVDVIDGQGNRQVVLDLRGMTGVDSAGLLVLVDALKRMDEYGGELLLSGPTSRVAERLRAAGQTRCPWSLRHGHIPLGAVSAPTGDGSMSGA